MLTNSELVAKGFASEMKRTRKKIELSPKEVASKLVTNAFDATVKGQLVRVSLKSSKDKRAGSKSG